MTFDNEIFNDDATVAPDSAVVDLLAPSSRIQLLLFSPMIAAMTLSLLSHAGMPPVPMAWGKETIREEREERNIKEWNPDKDRNPERDSNETGAIILLDIFA